MYDDPGRRITDAINTDPAEVERLRQARSDAKEPAKRRPRPKGRSI